MLSPKDHPTLFLITMISNYQDKESIEEPETVTDSYAVYKRERSIVENVYSPLPVFDVANCDDVTNCDDDTDSDDVSSSDDININSIETEVQSQ